MQIGNKEPEFLDKKEHFLFEYKKLCEKFKLCLKENDDGELEICDILDLYIKV